MAHLSEQNSNNAEFKTTLTSRTEVSLHNIAK